MKQWVMGSLWGFRLEAGEGGHLSLHRHVQTGCGAHPYPTGKGRERTSLPGPTATGNEANNSPEAGESSQWAVVSILYIFICVCTKSQRQVFRRVWLYKNALIIPAS